MTDDNIQNIKSLTSIEQINSIIKKKDIAYTSHHTVPSLKRDVPFSEINTSQQKRLVKSVLDSPVYNTEFIYTLREILKENCQDPQVDIDSLTIIDKFILALSLRIKSIGNDIETEIQIEGENVNVTLDGSKILQLALDTVQNLNSETIQDQYYVIECSVPTISTEYKLEKELRPKPTKLEIDNVEEMRETIGDVFTSEIVKYINKVSIKGENDQLIPIEWNRFSYADRIKIVETFKIGILKDILSFINKVTKEIDKITLIKFNFKDNEYERRLTIDGGFFTIS